MTKRQKKKIKNRAGFFHYRDYKLRLTIENGDTNRMRRRIKASSACEAMGMDVD